MSDGMAERWLPIPGFEGDYEVSDLGRVKSYKRNRVRILRPAYNPQGYLTVALSMHAVRIQRPVHHLVALTFLGPRPPKAEIRHLDGSRDNNAAANLAYGTKSQNTYDAVGHGTHPQARKTHCAQGHPFDEENTYFPPGKRARHCRECNRTNLRLSRARRRQKEQVVIA